MANEKKAIFALGQIARRHPNGAALLFKRKGIDGKATGQQLAAAIKSGKISAGELYEGTYGQAFDAWNDFAPNAAISVLNAQAAAAAKKKEAEKGKFENIINTLLGTANQAADIYAKFKNPGQSAQPDPAQMAAPSEQPAGKVAPWMIFAGAGAVVVILIIVLLFVKKK